jgi:hypothetical protein
MIISRTNSSILLIKQRDISFNDVLNEINAEKSSKIKILLRQRLLHKSVHLIQ